MAGGVARSVQSWSPIAMETAGMAADPNLDLTNGGMAAADYLAQATQEAQMAPAEAPAAPINPDDYEARARAAMAAMEAAALQQKKSAGNPLNVVGSILGGVIGLPLRFLDNALAGENHDLTAPFRPKQQAESRYQSTLAAIGEKRAEFEKDLSSIRGSRAQELKTALGSDRDAEQSAYDEMGRLASGLLYLDPSIRAQRAAPQLAVIAQRYPMLKGQIDTLFQSNFADDALVTLGSMSKDEGARARVNEYLYGTKTPSLGNGVAVSIPSRPGLAPQVITRGGTVSAAPYIGMPTAPAAPTAAPQTATGPVNITDFMNVPSGNPLDPNLGNAPNVRRPVAPASPPPGFVLD